MDNPQQNFRYDLFSDYSLKPILLIINLMEQLRRTILAQEETIAGRSRFGLFSQPPPLSLGDDSQYQAKKLKKGEDGKPKTMPRQMLPGPNKSGVLKKSFLQVPESIYQKDPYIDTFKKQLQYQKKMHTHSPDQETDFVPASGTKTIINAAYQHVEQKQFEQKKVKKDENGKVKTQPCNFQTNPTSKIQYKLFKHVPHMPDPYSRAQQIAKQEKLLWRSKVKHEVMFKSMSHGNTNFTKNKVQYGIDDKTKMNMSQKKSHVYGNSKRVSHQTKFKLARRGHGDPIGRYPEFVKPRQRAHTQFSEKIKAESNQEEKDDWKPSSGGIYSRPTPSITLMSKNMRKYV